MRVLPTTLALLTVLTGAAAAPSRAEVERWPVLYRAPVGERRPAQTFTREEAGALGRLTRTVAAHPSVKALHRRWIYAGPLTVEDALFSLVAPYRSGTPERLTVFRFSEGEPPVTLVVLSSEKRTSAWVIEPRGNMSMCGIIEGYTVRDLDTDGRREFAVVIGCGDGGWNGATLDLFAWKAGRLIQTAAVSVRSNEAGPPGLEESATVYVRKGPKPSIVSVVEQVFSVWSERQQQSTVTARKTLLRPAPPLPRTSEQAWEIKQLW